jgi:hypothetical protein
MPFDTKTFVIGALVSVVAAIAAFFLGRRSATTPAPAAVPAAPSPVQVTEEQKAQQKADVAQVIHDKEADTAAIDRSQVLAQQVAEQEQAAPALLEDQEALNKALLDAGQEARKP